MNRFQMLPLLCAALFGASVVGVNAGETKSGFVDKVFKGADGDVKYIVFVPKDYKGDKAYPVILFLHGAGESGTDGKKQAIVGLGKAIRDKGEDFPFIVVFPQSQKGGWKADSTEGKRAIAILEDVERDYKTDKKRVYLTGLSMGGSGTWSQAVAHPDRWAAIAPICGSGDPTAVSKIKSLPIWSFCGDKDSMKLVDNNRAMAKALKEIGANARYDEYPGVPHNSWDRAYATPELYTWFLQQPAKAAPPVASKTAPPVADKTSPPVASTAEVMPGRVASPGPIRRIFQMFRRR